MVCLFPTPSWTRFLPSLSVEPQLDILVVDDNPTDLVFFGRAANRTLLNIRLQTLTAGQQAIDYLEAKGEYNDRSRFPWPDLIVLDQIFVAAFGRRNDGRFPSDPWH